MKKLLRLVALAGIVAGVIAWLQRRPAPPSASPTAPPNTPGPTAAPVVPAEGVAPTEVAPVATAWVEPTPAGECPEGYPVKAKEGSEVFHVPGGALYDRTVPDRCYASPEAAEADGLRQSLR